MLAVYVHIGAQEAEVLNPRKQDIVDHHGYFRQIIYALHAGKFRLAI
jgi:hypothetical protein